MISLIIIIISLILDGVITNFLPYMIDNLTLFTPLTTVVCIFLIYPLYHHEEKKYFIVSFIIGIIYDLLYTNLLFFNAFIFLLIAFITMKIYKNFNVDYLKLIPYIIIVITMYECITSGIFIIFNLVPITIQKIIYKILHSLVFNIIYAEVIYLIINNIPKKYKKLNIN